jgi:hypothetical protein
MSLPLVHAPVCRRLDPLGQSGLTERLRMASNPFRPQIREAEGGTKSSGRQKIVLESSEYADTLAAVAVGIIESVMNATR